ncbi:hypothetical protein DRW03_08935 [Corallococcus sp. H22C18031201]|nr:hypothetical protein DRW03_08935 [Corallococcus sp. H22C18031201]
MADTLNRLLDKIPDALAQKIPDVNLGAQDIDVTVAQGTFTRENILPPLLDLKDFTLSFEAAGDGTLRNFNSVGDKDDNGIVGDPPQTSPNGAGTSLQPQLLLDGTRGWMRYQVSARIKSGANAKVFFVAASGQGEFAATLSDYRAHGLDERMPAAVKADLSAPRLAVQQTDLSKLGVGDALGWQTRGQLKTSVTVNWADLFTANLAALTFVKGGELLGIKLALSASVTASVSVTDDFQVSFSRPRTGRIEVAVRKAKSRETAMGAGLSLSLEFADKNAVKDKLADLVTAIAGKPMAEVDALAEKAANLQLSDLEKKALALILDRLGLDPQLADLTTVKAKWEELKATLQSTLEKVAQAQISAGFRYEYLRIPQASTLLQVELDDAVAMQFHGGLIRGNLEDLLGWLRDPAHAQAFTLKSFLRQTSLAVRHNYGFTLGLGSAEVLTSRTTRELSWVTQENVQGARRMAFQGQRGYEDTLLGTRGQWMVDLKAEMTQFSPSPVASDFYCGLHFMLSGSKKKLSRDDLSAAMDDAVVWGALDEKDVPGILDSLKDAVNTEALETRLDLKVDNDTFRAMLPGLQGFDVALFARVLARAMPWSSNTARARADTRQIVYGPMWDAYLREVRQNGSARVQDLAPTRAAQIAGWVLKNDASAHAVGQDLMAIESIFRPPGGAFSFAEVTDKNPRTLGKCLDFVEGVTHLNNAFAQRWGPESFQTVFGKLEGMWNTGFHLRATGALLLELAKGTSRGLASVERTFTVKRVEKDQQLVFTTARGSGTP